MMRELFDKQAIHEVLMRYCRGLDRADLGVLSSAFDNDARVEMGPNVFVGGAIAEALIDVASSARLTSHFIGNELVSLDGDSAFCESYFIATSILDIDGVASMRTRGGRYLDRLVYRQGEWRISERIVVEDWSRANQLPEGPAPTLPTGQRGSADPLYWFVDDAGVLARKFINTGD